MGTRQAYRDSSGKTLEDYPRPSVAVDTAVLTIARPDGLAVLLTHGDRDGSRPQWRLPGTFLHPGETLADAVLRSLRDKAGVEGLDPRQLHVFDDPKRDNRGWVLSIAHLDVVRAERIPSHDNTCVVPVSDVPKLPFDHGTIVEFAVAKLRAEYRERPDPARLVPDALPGEPEGAFTILDLRRVHDAVLGNRSNADTFRRSMLPLLSATGHWRRGARGKPAELYVRAG